MLSPIVTAYVDAALAQLNREGLMKMPGKLPAAMQDDSIPSSIDWIGWRAIPSMVTNEQLDSLERESGLRFPPLYRDLLRYRYYVELTSEGLSFEQHLPDEWEARLRWLYRCEPKRLVNVGLLPFGLETWSDAGLVCFDCRDRKSNGDCPVVYWDHECVGTEKEVQQLFSSSQKMFECLTFSASNELYFFNTCSDDGAALLSKKRELLESFLSIDPEGAGGPARTYWTGVE